MNYMKVMIGGMIGEGWNRKGGQGGEKKRIIIIIIIMNVLNTHLRISMRLQ